MLKSDWEDEFDKKFHERIWNIVKVVSPSSYVIAEAHGLLEGDGPQIYGEIKEFFREVEKAAYEQGYEDGTDSGHADVVGYLDSDSTDWQEAIEAEKKAAYERGVKAVKLPEYDHKKCPFPDTCIGYMNAESDLENEKGILLSKL